MAPRRDSDRPMNKTAARAPGDGATAQAHSSRRVARAPSRALRWLLQLRPHEVELLRPARSAPPLSWFLLAAGLVALATALLWLQPGLARRSKLVESKSQLEAALERMGPRPASGGAPSPHTGRSELLLETQEVRGELRRPWHEFFDQLETAAAADGSAVHVVQLSVEPRFATVQLVAEARGLDKLVRFSQRLSAAAPIRAMSLTNYEWRDALGGHVVSATMQGELSLPPALSPSRSLSLAAAGPSP